MHSSSCLLANSTVTVSVTGGSSQMFQLIMEMPLFNETTLGTTIYCAPTTAPCGLPLQGFYDFIFIIAIIIAGGGFLVALANKEISGDERQNVVLDFVLAVLFILLFPVIYNNIALLTNYLDMTIVAGPNFPYTDYGMQISLVWSKLLAWAQGGSIWGMLVSPITTLAGWIVALIVYLMSIFLGVVRIWLVTVTVIGFPISLALKQVPFARKLSSMVEDTLYGLILASLLSSVAIGVAAYVLADAPGGPVWSATIFAGTGINGISNWVAASALFTAILLPTVFAPLTGTLFQTASQASMVGVGVAVSMAGAGVAPMAGATGVGLAGAGGVGGLGRGMSGAVGQAPQTIGQEAASTMQSMGLGERLLYAVPHSLKNMAVVGTTGVLAGMGASSSARSIATVAPLSNPATVSRGIGQVNATRLETAQAYETSAALQGVEPDNRNPRLQRSYRAHLRRRVPQRSGSCSEPLVRPAESGRPRPVPLPGAAEPHHQRSAVSGLGQRPKSTGGIRRSVQAAAERDIGAGRDGELDSGGPRSGGQPEERHRKRPSLRLGQVSKE